MHQFSRQYVVLQVSPTENVKMKILISADLVIKFTPMSSGWGLIVILWAQPLHCKFIQTISCVAVQCCLATADSLMSLVLSVRWIFLFLCWVMEESIVSANIKFPFIDNWSLFYKVVWDTWIKTVAKYKIFKLFPFSSLVLRVFLEILDFKLFNSSAWNCE